METVNNNPQNLQSVIDAMSQEINCNESLSLSNGNMDTYIQYFYNLIAMAAFFGSISGLYIAINNQGNLSAIAARKCISPTNKLTSITASLLASFVAQVICVSIGITYILFILKVDMGDKIPMVYLSGAVRQSYRSYNGILYRFIRKTKSKYENGNFNVGNNAVMLFKRSYVRKYEIGYRNVCTNC